jgi:hypothetical protein
MTDSDDHWRSLPSSSWEFKGRKNKNLRLTNANLDYFREFSDSSYTDSKMENKHIPSVLNNLPTRFEDLSEDISFLKQSDETTEELWEEMFSIDQRASHLNNTLSSTQLESENDELQLGYEIGSMLELMMSGFASKQDRTDVARGFVLAFSGEAREGIDEDRITALEFARLLAEKHPPQARTTTEAINNMRKAVGIEDQVEVALPNALKQQGITPSQHLLDMLEEKAEKTTDQRSASKPEWNGEITFYDTSISTAEAESLVDYFLQSYPEIRDFDDLCEPLLKDIYLVETTEYQGTPTVKIANNLWQEGKRCTASTIDSEIDTNTSLPYTIHTLYCLSSEHNDKLLTSQPIAIERFGGWELTNYGDIIAYLLFETKKEVIGARLQDFIDNPKVHPDEVSDSIFGLKLIGFLHKTAVSPTTIDPKFVNLMKEMCKDNGSCMDWRDRVSTIDGQD